MNSFSDMLKTIVYIIVFIMLIAIGLKVTLFLFKVIIDIALIALICWGIYKLYNRIKMKIQSRKYDKKGYNVRDDGIIDVKYEDVDKDKR